MSIKLRSSSYTLQLSCLIYHSFRSSLSLTLSSKHSSIFLTQPRVPIMKFTALILLGLSTITPALGCLSISGAIWRLPGGQYGVDHITVNDNGRTVCDTSRGWIVDQDGHIGVVCDGNIIYATDGYTMWYRNAGGSVFSINNAANDQSWGCGGGFTCHDVRWENRVFGCWGEFRCKYLRPVLIVQGVSLSDEKWGEGGWVDEWWMICPCCFFSFSLSCSVIYFLFWFLSSEIHAEFHETLKHLWSDLLVRRIPCESF